MLGLIVIDTTDKIFLVIFSEINLWLHQTPTKIQVILRPRPPRSLLASLLSVIFACLVCVSQQLIQISYVAALPTSSGKILRFNVIS